MARKTKKATKTSNNSSIALLKSVIKRKAKVIGGVKRVKRPVTLPPKATSAVRSRKKR